MVGDLKDLVAKQADFEISSQRVDFYGWCPGCEQSSLIYPQIKQSKNSSFL
ncbi:MAG: hypothetical protein CM1200mP35_04070 [Chloroflexota bacterium]|nr:MAG: hypothetical protein CM1200mP35_04070 [Chloroflexota bacterium]